MHQNYTTLLFLFTAYTLFFILPTTTTNAARILSIFPFPGPSQYIFGSALLKELAQQGHEVTSISVYPQQKPLKNFRDIEITENAGLFDDSMHSSDDLNKESLTEMFTAFYDLCATITENVLKNAQVQKLLNSKTEHFDLVIVETLATESLYGFAQHFNAPIIGVSTFSTTIFVDALVGNTSPVSYCPNAFIPLSSKMSFAERLFNLAMDTIQRLVFKFYQMPKQRAIYQQHFPAAKVTLDNLMTNFSLVFLNQHFTLHQPRPYVPNMIEVGGLHIKQQPDPLPADLKQFLDSATEGVIYFSLGSNYPSKKLTPEKREILLRTFASLKQKVLWKFEDDSIKENISKNVYISEWFPQPAVLAHRNVKVFISHGGRLSTIETIYHGKPMLGIPLFADQPLNVAIAVGRGFALSADIHKLNEVELREKIKELLENPSYMETVRNMSKRYRDQPMSPLETAVYWTEYVLRHDGAPHMRNAGQDLNFLQYHSLDTILTIFGLLLLLVFAFVMIIRKLLKFVVNLGGGPKKLKPSIKLKKR